METISFKNRLIQVRRSDRARRLRLQIGQDATMTMVRPKRVFQWEINLFLKRHQPWIDKQFEKLSARQIQRPKIQYRDGEFFYYFGEKLKLQIDPQELKRPKIKVKDDRLVVQLYKKVAKPEAIKQIKKVIELFYKKKADEVIHDRLQFFSEHYGFKYNRVTLRNQKSRWGSCSRLKNLNFNWRLIMAPIEVIDYVVVHELCHLKQMNHSSKFWALVEERIPNHKVRRKWLRENHHLLII